MPLKKHHKWIIGGSSTLVIIFMIIISLLVSTLFARQEINYNQLDREISALQADTQTKLNELTNNLMQTKESISSLDESFKSELKELKASASPDFSEIIEASIHSVVTIRTNIAQGTGFIIDEEGYIITNAHVLNGASAVSVLTYEQNSFDASLVGYNSQFDLALLKISGNYEKLELDNSENIEVGEKVIAIGNPLGLQFSVSEGIVSATQRVGVNGIEAYIQTDAALNPGNSGGPLINKQGQVIGINNFKVGGGENLGFALESNYLEEIINAIAVDNLGKELI